RPARLHEGRDDRFRRRRERPRARRLAGLRDRGRERAGAREGARALGVPVGRGRRRGAGSRSASRLEVVIDLRAARHDPDGYRAALARKGAGEAFDELLAVDLHKRELQTHVEELRAKSKPKGKPTPEQLAELRAVKDTLQPLEAELAQSEKTL